MSANATLNINSLNTSATDTDRHALACLAECSTHCDDAHSTSIPEGEQDRPQAELQELTLEVVSSVLPP